MSERQVGALVLVVGIGLFMWRWDPLRKGWRL